MHISPQGALEDTGEIEGWYCYSAGFLGTQRVHVPGRLDHQIADYPLLDLYYNISCTTTKVWNALLSFRAVEGLLPQAKHFWVHESDFSWMRCNLHRGMWPTDEYTPTTEGTHLPTLTIGTGNGVDMTLTPRRPHMIMDLKYLLRTQEGLPLYTQAILASWPPRSLMESTTARVLSLVQAAPRATWLVRLGFFQDLLGKMAAVPQT